MASFQYEEEKRLYELYDERLADRRTLHALRRAQGETLERTALANVEYALSIEREISRLNREAALRDVEIGALEERFHLRVATPAPQTAPVPAA